MKFKKKDLKELVERYHKDPHKLYEEFVSISNKIPEFEFVVSECDNLLNYRDGFVNIEFKNKKWYGSVWFLNGHFKDMVIVKNR